MFRASNVSGFDRSLDAVGRTADTVLTAFTDGCSGLRSILTDAGVKDPQVEGRARALRERALQVVQLLPQVPEEILAAFNAIEGPSALADFIAGMMDVSPEEKQALLETFDLRARLDKIIDLLTHRIEVLKVSREVEQKTRESIGDSSRSRLN